MAILTHHKGMMSACRIITREENRTRVHVVGNKYPKWVAHDDEKWHLGDSTEEAEAWLKNQGDTNG